MIDNASIDPAIATAEHRVLRRVDVEHKTGLKRAHLYALMRIGRFPKSFPLGTRAVGWDSLEVEQWIAERRAERD